MTELPSSNNEEKPPLPQIVVTPSTPSDEREFHYPVGRLATYQPNYEEEYYDEFDTLPPPAGKSTWRSLVPVRVLRLTGVLAVVVAVLLIHVVISNQTHTGDTGETE